MKKLASVLAVTLLGFIFAFLLLEAGFQAAHAISVWKQKNALQKQTRHTKQQTDKKLTIMCVGESMTKCPPGITYTDFLEENLRAKYPGTDITVINKGIPRSTSKITLREMPSDIKMFSPDIVIVMMGINDVQTLLTKDHIKSRIKPSFWNRFRSIYFIKYLLFELKRQKQTSYQKQIPENLEEQFNYYTKVALGNYFLELDDCHLLDQIMLRHAKTEFEKTFWLAKQQLNENNPGVAWDMFEKAASLAPERPETYALMYVCLPDKNTPQAQELKKQCRQHCKSESEFLFKWGFFCQQYHLFKKARKAYTAGMKLEEPSKTRFTLMMAGLNFQTDNLRLAAHQFKQVLKKDPENPEALNKMGLIYNKIGKYEEAEKYLKHLAQVTHEYSYALYTLGRIYQLWYEENPTDKALLENACKYIEIAYSHSAALDWGKNRLLTEIYEKLGHKEKMASENERFRQNYQQIYALLAEKNIKLVAMQYPMRDVEDLKQIFTPEQRQNIVFVDNTPGFEKLLSEHSDEEVFLDHFAGDFGHYTALGGKTMAKTIQKALEDELNK